MVAKEKINSPYHRLKYIMDKQGVKQSDIASLLDKNISTVNQKINRSTGRDFTLSEAQKIAVFLNIDLADFF
jgi:transcriptional regulator with XRE-family HTH domain